MACKTTKWILSKSLFCTRMARVFELSYDCIYHVLSQDILSQVCLFQVCLSQNTSYLCALLHDWSSMLFLFLKSLWTTCLDSLLDKQLSLLAAESTTLQSWNSNNRVWVLFRLLLMTRGRHHNRMLFVLSVSLFDTPFLFKLITREWPVWEEGFLLGYGNSWRARNPHSLAMNCPRFENLCVTWMSIV